MYSQRVEGKAQRTRHRKSTARRRRLLQSGMESLEVRSLLAADAASAWHNTVNPTDVNADGHVVPLDALLIINELNRSGSHAVEAPASSSGLRALSDTTSVSSFYDVNNDGFVAPVDALMVINALADASDVVELKLRVLDSALNEITQVKVGTNFIVEATARDLRTNPGEEGVFAAFMDVIYDGGVAADEPGPPASPIFFGEDYPNSTAGIRTSGQFDEIGGISNVPPLDLDANVVWRVVMRATATGTVTFTPSAADETPDHFVLLYDNDDPVNVVNDVDFIATNPLQTVVGTDAPTVTIDDVTVTEGNSGLLAAVFNVHLSAASNVPVTLAYRTTDGTAISGSPADFNAIAEFSEAITFDAGVTDQAITVFVRGDTRDEDNETFNLNLISATNATLGDRLAVGTINDNDTSTININNAVATEGDVSPTNAVFTVSLSTANSREVIVAFTTQPGTALAGSDYTTTAGSLTFQPGTTSQSITVPVTADTTSEQQEQFTVVLSNPVNAALGTATGTAQITDNDAPAGLSISIGDATQDPEGNVGDTNLVVGVQLNSPVPGGETVTVRFATADGTAVAGTDYNSQTGTLTFTSGNQFQNITVGIKGDTLDEIDETFSINLDNPTGATIGDAQATITISDDDASPTVSIADATPVNEGNTGTADLVFNVTLSAASGRAVTVAFDAQDGTATLANNDYVNANGTLTFTAGSTQRTITVLVNGDTAIETDEQLTVNLASPVGATIADGQASGTITNDDVPAPTLSINDVTQAEGNTGTSNFVFTVTLAGVAITQNTTVQFATSDGTATTGGADYQPANGTLTFTPGGSTTQSVTVQVGGDTATEGNETFTVTLSNATAGVNITKAQGIGTITNDDGPATLAINDVTVTEGSSGTTNAVFTVTRSGNAAEQVTVVFATGNDTAVAPGDYTAANGTLTFAPGSTQQQITVAVNPDTTSEPQERFQVNLTNPSSNATITDPQGTGTITDDDGLPTISVADISVNEGDSGTTNAVFTITLSSARSTPVTVNFATAEGTATLANNDYQAASGSVTFAANETSKTVTTIVTGDTVQEPNETYTLNLSNPNGATLADNSATATIVNDDGTRTISINDPAAVTEGNTGSTNLVFTVTLAGAAATSPITVQFATANDTATSGTDFTTASGTLTFNAGESSKTITVQVTGDTIDEANERFFVNLSNATSGVTLSDSQGIGTINDDDSPPTLSVADVSVSEGNAGTTNLIFNVNLSAASGQQVTVQFATANGTASAPSDFTATSGTLTFGAGQLTRPVTVVVQGDTATEANETLQLNLSNAVGASILDGQATGTINNDDGLPGLSVSDVTQTEGNSGTTNFVFTVTRGGGAISQNVTVQFNTSNGTASTPEDYVAQSGTLTFTPDGPTSQAVTVVVNGDTQNEANETFNLNLTNASGGGATISDAQGIGTINNDDAAPSLSIDDVTVTEGNSGTVSAVFNVRLSSASGQTVRANFVTSNDTAVGSTLAGGDFLSNSGTVTFNAGTTTQTVTVQVNGDTFNEGASERFLVRLSSPVNAELGDAEAFGIITDDDPTGNVEPGSVSGMVFLDRDNDGEHDEDEIVQGGVTVQLTGTSSQGTAVNLSTTTDATGSYTFVGLAAGNYQVVETQPDGTIDGREAVGTQGGSSPSNDMIQVSLSQSTDGSGNNFGERLPTLEYFSKRNYLNTTAGNSNSQASSALTLDEARLADFTSDDGLVTRRGDTVTVRGTDDEDVFEITGGDDPQIVINGVAYQLDTSAIANIEVIGGDGDSATLTGSTADEAATVELGSGSLVSDELSISVSGVSQLSVAGGGGDDSAEIQDSAGDDALDASGNSVSITSGDLESFLEDFANVVAQSNRGGADTAHREAVDFVLQLQGGWTEN